MVDVILGFALILVFIFFIFGAITCLLIAFKLWNHYKNAKETAVHADKDVTKSFDSPKEDEVKPTEEEKKQLDYVENVYKLVDDVLSGKQELGDKEDEA